MLPPSNPHGPALRRFLSGLPSGLGDFSSTATVPGRQHLFTDGEGYYAGHTDLATAAWAVVHAGTGLHISGAPLCGLLQSVPRAELSAVISVQWTAYRQVESVIWTDSLNVAVGALQLQEQQFDWDDQDHQDLWCLLAELLADMPTTAVTFKHVPSHLEVCRCTSPFEEWVAVWNNFADLAASIRNSNRSWDFVQVHRQAEAHFQHQLRAQRALRAIYCNIAAITASERPPRNDSIEEARVAILGQSGRTRFPICFRWIGDACSVQETYLFRMSSLRE